MFTLDNLFWVRSLDCLDLEIVNPGVTARVAAIWSRIDVFGTQEIPRVVLPLPQSLFMRPSVPKNVIVTNVPGIIMVTILLTVF